jgi:hypothetical protein
MKIVSRHPWQLLLLAAGLVWLTVGLVQWLGAAPLGQDEARFALAARDFLHGREPRWYYVSSGMNAIAVPGLAFGGDEITLRIVPFAAGVGFFVLAMLFAWRVFGPTTAAWSMAVLAGSRSVIQRSTELLSDLPAAGLLIGGTWVLITEFDREDGPRWRLVWAAPLFAAALYVRYGSAVPIAIVSAACIVMWWRSILRQPKCVVATVGLFALLLVPHMIAATRMMGAPWGILIASREVPGDEFGLVTYLTNNPFLYYGLVAPVPMLAGVVSIAWRRDRRSVFVWVVAVSALLAIGLLTHAQARYVLFSTVLLVALGTHALIGVANAHAGRFAPAVAAIATAAIVASWINCMRQAWIFPDGVRVRTAGTFMSAAAIRDDAAGAPCKVMGRYLMRLEWYSGCEAVSTFPSAALQRGERIYAVWTDLGTPQPDFASLPGMHRSVLDARNARVIRIEPIEFE